MSLKKNKEFAWTGKGLLWHIKHIETEPVKCTDGSTINLAIPPKIK